MRLYTSVLLSTFLLAGVATSAQAMESRFSSKSDFNSPLQLFSQQQQTKNQENCEIDDPKPGCSRRDLRVFGSFDAKSSLLAETPIQRQKADAPCTQAQIPQDDDDQRGSGRCKP
ncbi:heterocyst-inhibiting protein PatX [Phormidium sp. CCY1219]|uniref:heterocyst-inhibiting protein PatX n=1 Tax=Phormidium sp. CCY1219 TaxID=2886104 RepID=UPI002D1F2FC4|nr:hypothetical protein [Phormidium sp. CCY1219]MEB3831573.1 hypothetical protein [Phormidium sp. CCY1219]